MPCYKRPEYTQKCIKALEEAQEYPRVSFCLIDDGSGDKTKDLLTNSTLPNKYIISYTKNRGLRNVMIDFFKWTRALNFDFLAVVGNDVLMPKDWLNKMLDAFEGTDADILSPNYMPSNPAYTQGEDDVKDKGYRPAKGIVGLWFMKADMIKDVHFERHNLWGIKGASRLLMQIKIEKMPKIGWVTDVVAQDLGHWSGKHPEHIKNAKHLDYYNEVGRNLAYA